MILNKDRLMAFFQVVMDKSFNKASDNLCITQSALSQRILKLEQEIETVLLIRAKEGVRLTESGRMLFEYVRSIKSMEQEVLDKIGCNQSQSHLTIRIGAYSSILRSAVIPALASLISSSKEVHIEFFSRELRELPEMLKNGEVDFILLDSLINKREFEYVKLAHETLIHISHKDLVDTDQAFLDHDVEDMTTYNFFNQQGDKDIQVRRCYYDHIDSIIDGVKLGLGQAIVSKHLVQQQPPELVKIEHAIEPTLPVVLYFSKNRYLTKFHQQIIQELKDKMSSYLT